MNNIRLWYRDRDFPEIKVSNAEILLACSSPDSPRTGSLDNVIKEHNHVVNELIQTQAKLQKLEAELSWIKYPDKMGE